MTTVLEVAEELRDAFDGMHFGEPVTHVYNPFKYAWKPCARYIEKYASDTPREILMIGMNPGPWGMAQTGVPFGDVDFVRDWLGIDEPVAKPENEHPKREVDGFDCHRNEVSGSRLWGWAQERFGEPENFFDRFFVWNFCPLSFMEESGRNRTPNKLPVDERTLLLEPCEDALRKLVKVLEPEHVIGIGAFAEKQAKRTLKKHYDGKIGRILHPSPASPKANKGWVKFAEEDFAKMGIKL